MISIYSISAITCIRLNREPAFYWPQAREARHFSQREVAELVGTTQSSISRVENGASIPSFDRVVEVLHVMGLSVDLQIELIEVDEAPLSRNLELDPAARFKNAVHEAQFALAAVKGWHDVIFEPLQILAVLQRHHVDFVTVGGLAAVMHGSDMATFDLDVTPQRRRDNLERLASALQELGVAIRVEGVSFDFAATPLERVSVLNLTTTFGDLDLVMRPAGHRDYDAIVAGASEFEIDGVIVQIASLADVIASKEASHRAKDRLALPGLRIMQRKIANDQKG